MAEQQGVQGNIWLDKAIDILRSIGWIQHGTKNVDIKIPGRSHPTGIDAYFTYYDPYESKYVGVIVDGKRYNWDNIRPSVLKPMVEKLSNDLREIPHTDDFKANFVQTRDHRADIINTGVIMMWVHGSNPASSYNYKDFQKYLKELGEIPKIWDAQRIFFITNTEILRICSIIQTRLLIAQQVLNKPVTELKFYYPILSTTKNTIKNENILTIESIFSKYIFIKTNKTETSKNGSIHKNILIVLYMDTIDFNNLYQMYNAISKYQLIDCDEVWVYIYNDDTTFLSAKNHFQRVMEEQHPEVKFVLKSMVPISDAFIGE